MKDTTREPNGARHGGIGSGVDLDELAARCHAAFPRLDGAERRIAVAVYRALADGAPVGADAVARRARVAPEAVERALEAWPGVYRDGEGRVIGFWGLSLVPMDHRILLAGERELYGWCAWDTLFLPEILGRDARVESGCVATEVPISLEVRRDGPAEVTPPGAMVSLIDPERADVAGDRVLSSFCHHIHFLASREVGERWVAERDDGAFLLTVREAWELGRAVNRLHYGDALRERAAGGGAS